MALITQHRLLRKILLQNLSLKKLAALGTNIAALNADRKAKEVELKKINKEIAKLEKKKADADEKIAAELNRKKAEDIVANALASGMTAEEIAELLK